MRTGRTIPALVATSWRIWTVGLSSHFLSDGGTDFYHKVSEITVTDPAHAVFGVHVGDSTENVSSDAPRTAASRRNAMATRAYGR